LGHAPELLLEQADTADPDGVGAELQQLRKEIFVGSRVQGGLQDFDPDIRVVRSCEAGYVQQPDRRDVHLRDNAATNPAPLIVCLDQQNSTAARQLRQGSPGALCGAESMLCSMVGPLGRLNGVSRDFQY